MFFMKQILSNRHKFNLGTVIPIQALALGYAEGFRWFDDVLPTQVEKTAAAESWVGHCSSFGSR